MDGTPPVGSDVAGAVDSEKIRRKLGSDSGFLALAVLSLRTIYKPSTSQKRKFSLELIHFLKFEVFWHQFEHLEGKNLSKDKNSFFSRTGALIFSVREVKNSLISKKWKISDRAHFLQPEISPEVIKTKKFALERTF